MLCIGFWTTCKNKSKVEMTTVYIGADEGGSKCNITYGMILCIFRSRCIPWGSEQICITYGMILRISISGCVPFPFLEGKGFLGTQCMFDCESFSFNMRKPTVDWGRLILFLSSEALILWHMLCTFMWQGLGYSYHTRVCVQASYFLWLLKVATVTVLC